MTQTIEIHKPLLLFPTRTGNLRQHKELPPGKYKVERINNPLKVGAEPWLKLVGEEWGNAAACWEALQVGRKSPLCDVEILARKGALLAAALLLATIPIKSNYWIALAAPSRPQPQSAVAVAVKQFTQGKIQVTAKLQRNPGYVVSEYSSGWARLTEIATGKRQLRRINVAQIQQIHRDALVLLMLVTLCWRCPKLVRRSFWFLLPALLVPVAYPLTNPEIDKALFFYYPALAAAIVALLWNNPRLEEEASKSRFVGGLTKIVAATYNVMMLPAILTNLGLIMRLTGH